MPDITVSWDSVSNADSYDVFHRVGGTADYLGDYTKVTNTTNTSYTETVTEVGSHSYRIVAINSGVPGTPSQDATFVIPEPPSNLAFSDTTASDQLTVTWNESTDVDGYYVFRSTNTGSTRSDYTQIADVSAPPITDTGLAGGTQYYYRASAYTDNGRESALSAEATAQTLYTTDAIQTWWRMVQAGDPLPFDVRYVQYTPAPSFGELVITPDSNLKLPQGTGTLAIKGFGQKISLSIDNADSYNIPNAVITSDVVIIRSDGESYHKRNVK